MRPILPLTLLASVSLIACGCGPDRNGSGESSTSGGSEGTASSTSGAPTGCGDGIVVAPEACDDGNLVDGDACNSDCQLSASLVWCKAELGEDGGGANGANAVGTDSQGNAILAAGVYSADLDAHVGIVAKYASDGTRVWTTVLEESRMYGLVVRADDSIVVSGSDRLFHLASSGEVVASTPPHDFYFNRIVRSDADVIAYAGSGAVVGVLNDDLTVRWSRKVDDQTAKTSGKVLAADLEGNWLLGGTIVVKTIDHGDAQATQVITTGFVRKYGRDGELRWSQTVPSTNPEFGHDITGLGVSPENEAIALGLLTNNALADAHNMTLSTLGPDGELRQQNTLPSDDYVVYGEDLAVRLDGGRIITGYARSVDELVYGFVARHDASGTRQWVFRNALVPDRSSSFHAVHVSADGDLFAVGTQSLENWEEQRTLVCKIRH